MCSVVQICRWVSPRRANSSKRSSDTESRRQPFRRIGSPAAANHCRIVASITCEVWTSSLIVVVPGWSIKKLVTTVRRYRSVAVQTGDQILHAGSLPANRGGVA
jgi:hypothetical protein